MWALEMNLVMITEYFCVNTDHDLNARGQHREVCINPRQTSVWLHPLFVYSLLTMSLTWDHI